jgi:U3 small nucleolar ribonucleoprotein protein IMP4
VSRQDGTRVTQASRAQADLKLRRQTRERREYIHRKSLASQEQAIYQRKQTIKDLVAQGKQLPTELRKEAKELGGKDLVLDEAQRGESSFGVE